MVTEDKKAADEDDDSEDGFYCNFVKDHIIYIHGDFDCGISKHVIPLFKQEITRQKQFKDQKIVIDISSTGGHISMLAELVALIEMAKSDGIIIETRAMSHAHSCGSILLASGTVGHRFVSPMTRVLVHHTRHWYDTSTDTQIEREYEHAKHVSQIMKKLLQRYTKIPAKILTAMLADDSYYVFGDDLIKFGIADKFAYEL